MIFFSLILVYFIQFVKICLFFLYFTLVILKYLKLHIFSVVYNSQWNFHVEIFAFFCFCFCCWEHFFVEHRNMSREREANDPWLTVVMVLIGFRTVAEKCNKKILCKRNFHLWICSFCLFGNFRRLMINDTNF